MSAPIFATPRRKALAIVLFYALLAGAWILFSDWGVELLAGGEAKLAALQRYKGLVFVAFTSVLLYGLLRSGQGGGEALPYVGSGASPRQSRPYIPLLVFFWLAMAVGVTGYAAFSHHEQKMRGDAEQNLTGITDLKVSQITLWLRERKGDALSVSGSLLFSGNAVRWLESGAPPGDMQKILRQRLSVVVQAYDYSDIALLDRSGRVRLSVKGDMTPLNDNELNAAHLAMDSGQIVMANFHMADGKPEIDFFAPLREPDGSLIRGALCFHVNPERFLFPLIKSWPVAGTTAESLLLQRDGGEVVFLSELRYRKDAPMSLRLPIGRADIPASLAAAGREGAVTGADYRGKPVLAVVRHVEGSPWYLVAKEDLDEVQNPIRQMTMLVVSLVVVFVAVAGGVIWLWWRRQQADQLAQGYRREMEKQMLARRFELLSRYANDAIFAADDGGVIHDVNERAEAMYGYRREQFLGMNVQQLRPLYARATQKADWAKAGDEEDGIVFEAVHQRQDGSTFPVEVSLRRIEAEGQSVHLGIVRDISERKAAENRLLDLANLYNALSRTNQAIIHAADPLSLFAGICRIAVEFGNFRFAWVGMPGEDGWVHAVSRHGNDQGYLDQLKVSIRDDLPEGRGPTGTAIREGRVYVVNDYGADPNTAPWRERLEQIGVRSAVAFPLFQEGRPVGAFTLYAGETGFFDERRLTLLEEMSQDVSFALDYFMREGRRERAEKKLRDSEERFHAIFDSVSDAIFIHALDTGAIVETNQRACEMYGYSREEMLALEVAVLSANEPPYTQREAQEWLRRAAAGEPQVFEWLARNRSGKLFWVEVSVRRAALGGEERLLVSVRDINERKEIELRMVESEERLRRIVETVPDILYTATLPNFDTTFISPAVEALLGFTPEEFVRDPQLWARQLYAEDREDALAMAGAAALNQANVRMTYRMWHKDGKTLRWFADRFVPECDEAGKPVRVTGAMTDITDLVLMEDALKASEDRYRELINNMKSGVVVCEARDDGNDFLIHNVNSAVERMEGVERRRIIGKSVREVFPGMAESGFLEMLRRVWQSGGAEHAGPLQCKGCHGPGWRESYVYRLPMGQVVMVYDDVSARMEALEKLRLDAKVFEASAESIIITDAERRVLAVNRMFTEVTGYVAGEVVGKEPVFLRADQQEAEFYVRLWETVNTTGHWVGEVSSRRKNGEVFPSWLAISAVKDENGAITHYTSILTDISERKEAEERIRYLTHHDALTGLSNQFMLMDHISLAIAHAKRNKGIVAVLALNLDRFRDVNERYGHPIGDQLLQTVALRLTSQLREGDTVARIGADNFVVVMPDLSDRHQAETVALKVLDTIGQPLRLESYEFHVLARMGLALYPLDGEQAADLMKNADVAMAAAKSGGRAFQFYNLDQSRELEENLALESAMRYAIERNELELYYQPRVDLVSGEIAGMEGLLRWNHPDKGLLLPGRFIAIAEQSGLILPIGEWVFWQACRQAKAWHEAGFPRLHVSVNVSVLQLRQSNLADTVRRVVEETGLNPNCLELEFTETFLMENEGQTGALLRRLKEIGVRFAIDDFGTGYSSLAYLKQFPIDVLKIDQSFVRDIAFDTADAAIVQGMIALGHSLKLRMVAEGVETEEQMGYLRSIHCDEMQGYFYSRPLPVDEMFKLLQSSRRLQDISTSPGVTRKLLLVDDEPNITTALNRLLRREGYQILTAGSGREALEILAVNSDVGVVVSDQRMPEMSGIELLSKVKVLYPHVVRIVLSGYTELNSVTEAINKGEIYRFLTKPWEDDALKDVIRDAFMRHEMDRSAAGTENNQAGNS